MHHLSGGKLKRPKHHLYAGSIDFIIRDKVRMLGIM